MRSKAAAKALYRHLPFKRALFSIVRRTTRLPERVYRHLHFEGPFAVPLGGGQSFQMYSYGDVVENELFWGFGSTWEQLSLQLWRSLAEASTGLILDIGANTGAYALMAQACRPDASVIAFEPVRRIAERLARNVALNGYKIEVEKLAVSDRSGTATFHDSESDNAYAGSLEAEQAGNSITYPVEVISIDDYFKKRPAQPVSLIKLDVEMHEPAALRGMAGMLQRDRPALLVEVLRPVIGEAVARELEGLGYRIFGIDEEAGLVPLDRPGPLHGRNWNNLFVTQDQFERAQLHSLVAHGKEPALP
jgi:FkbM family methyltransferase